MPHARRRTLATSMSGSNQVQLFTGSHLMDLPDEILLEVLKMVSPEDLSSVKRVNRRMRALVLNFTVRLDYAAFEKDAAVLCPAGFANLILQCPRLRSLSLVKPVDTAGHPECFMDSFLKPARRRIRFAKSLAQSCPEIRLFEVSSLNSLRMVREYARCQKQQSLVSEIRLYSCNSRAVQSVMLAIGQFCPKLRVFKFLRRAPAQSLPVNDTSYSRLWDSLSDKLYGFSTNVIDRAIIGTAISRLVHLRRLVIWFLTADEIDILTQHCQQLTSLILMSADPAGFRFLNRCRNLTDLTFHLPRDDHADLSAFPADFDAVFREIGPRLKRISFDFRKSPCAECLKNLTRCHNLTDLKLRGIADGDIWHLFHLMMDLKSLKSLTWKDEDETALTDIFKPDQRNITILFRKCHLLYKFILNDVQYARRSPAIRLIRESAGN